MSSITVSSLVLGSLTVEVDGADASLALSVIGTAPASLTIELGTPGAQGNAATIAVGTTTTLSPGSPATVTNAGTSSAAVFNFGIPQGTTGATGATGPGVPSGGLEGQIIVKDSDTDFDTSWQDNFATMLRVNARNETGSTLSKGTVVYISGASGNKPTLSKALATGDATSAQTLGVVTADILTNQNGTVTVRGLLENLDTSAYSAGAQLYLSPTTAGAWTTTKPSAPDHLVYVGIVVRSHANQGSVEVAIQNGFELEELHDVALASEANNDLLTYESATDLWKNKSASTLGLLTSATAASTYLAKASNLSDLANASTARTNLGLGTAAVEPATKLVPAGGTTGQALVKLSDADHDDAWATISASGSDVQAYKTPGTYTWTKPAGAKAVFVYVHGGGGGGGAGGTNLAANTKGGGGGGGPGGFCQTWMNAADLPSTVTITVGLGGAGGTARAAGSAGTGNAGTGGGATSFGTYIRGAGGLFGSGGSTGTGGAAGGGTTVSLFNLYGLTTSGGGAGGTTSGTLGNDGSAFQGAPAQGGGGGAGSLSTTANSGGRGGNKSQATGTNSGTNSLVAGGTGGVGTTSTPALPGTNCYAFGFGGTGGGGGFYRTATNGGTGGDGGAPGGGGGGGGAADTTNSSGAGGTGGAGFCLVITTL